MNCPSCAFLIMLLCTPIDGQTESGALVQPRAKPPTVVLKLPFAARFQSAIQYGDGLRLFSKGILSRDSSGRIRVESTSDLGEQTTAIVDHGADELIFLDKSARKAYISSAGLPQTAWAFSNSLPFYTSEHSILLGINCRRVLLKDAVTRHDAGETWLSEALSIVMLDIKKDVNATLGEWRITAISQEEPDPGLFRVPKDYATVILKD